MNWTTTSFVVLGSGTALLLVWRSALLLVQQLQLESRPRPKEAAQSTIATIGTNAPRARAAAGARSPSAGSVAPHALTETAIRAVFAVVGHPLDEDGRPPSSTPTELRLSNETSRISEELRRHLEHLGVVRPSHDNPCLFILDLLRLQQLRSPAQTRARRAS